MPKSKILYSTNALAAYRISNRYYGNKHYVWCSESFGPSPLSRSYIAYPPTSTPRWRYKTINEEIRGIDYHGPLIISTKAGLIKGVEEQLKRGIITITQRDEILYYIDHLQLSEYKPLLYVIVYDDVKHLVRSVPVSQKANPLSEEYIIEELPGDLFDVLDIDEL